MTRAARTFDPSVHRVLVAVALVLLPFAGKAFHVDDPSFLWAARHLAIAPLDPWGFTSFWSGAIQPAHQHVNHPPLQAYVVWLGTRLVGFREIGLHLVQQTIALGALVATARAARRLAARPGITVLVVACTPVFLVSATTLMSDVLFLATFTGAIASWLAATQRRARRDDAGAARGFALAALLAVLCTLTRYNGIALVPLLALHVVTDRRAGWSSLLWLVLPLAALAGQQTAAFAQHGHVPLRSASHYVALSDDGVALPFDLWIGVVHAGACLTSVACLAALLWSPRALAAGLALAAGVAWAVPHGLGVALGMPAEAIARPEIALQIGGWTAAGLALGALVVADLWQRRDAGALLLAAWCAGIFAFATVFNWAVNARSFLPLAPAVAILAVRRLDARAPVAGRAGQRARAIPLALAVAAALALAVASADARFANSARTLARETADRARAGGVRPWFRGHWGWQWYLEQGGGRGLDPMRATIEPGDWIVVPSWEPFDAFLAAAPLDELERVGPLPLGPLATLERSLGAGFHANATFGPLPFAFGPTQPLVVRVLRARQGFRVGVVPNVGEAVAPDEQ